jgi:hypothetical protein
MGFDRSYLFSVLSGLLGGLPVIAALATGLVLSVSRLGKRPRAAIAGTIAFSGLLLLQLISPFLSVLYLSAYRMGRSVQFMGIIQGIVQIFLALLHAAFLGVLIYALFFADKKRDGTDTHSA